MKVVTPSNMLKISKILSAKSKAASVLVPLRANLATTAAVAEDLNEVSNWNNARPYSEIPGPSMWEMFKMFRPGGSLDGADFFEIVGQFQKRYGNLCKLPGMAGKKDLVFVYEPEDIAKIYRTEGKFPIRQGLDSVMHHRAELRPDIYGVSTGLGSEQGPGWWDMRKKVNPVMMKPTATKVYVPKIDEISHDFVKRIQKSKDAENRFGDEFLPMLGRWALESVCYISMDVRIGLLGEEPNPMAEKFMRTLKLFFEHSYKLDVLPSAWKYYKTPLYKAAMKNNDDMVEGALFFLNQGKQALEEKKRTNNLNTEDTKGFLEKLLEIDESYALIMTMDSIIAGVDTTGTSFFNLLYNLALNPEKQEILRKEIMGVLPNEDSSLTMDNMKDMSYMRACIKESFRYTPFFNNFRSAGKDIVIQGYRIPQNTNMSMGLNLLLRNDAHFPRNNEFLPERFLRNNDEAVAAGCPSAKTANPFIYLPFGFGPRMCIGRRIAELEMEALICRMLRQFRVEWNGPPPTYQTSLGQLPVGKTNFIFNTINRN